MTLRAPHFSPKRERKVQAPLVLPSLLVTALFVPDAPFFAHEETIPLRPTTQQPLQLGSPLTLIENAGEKPFNQNEHPNPSLVFRSQTDLQGSFIALAGIQPDPFFQSDWPNPTLRKVQEPYNLPSFIALVVEPEIPFKQDQWPNPTLRVNIQTPFQVGSSLTLIEDAGEKPFFQSDWITPPGKPTLEPYQIGKSISLVPTLDVVPDLTLSARFESSPEVSARYSLRSGPFLILEDGSGVLLLEDGFRLLLEEDPLENVVTATFNLTTTTKARYGR
jgi:hypothetical protein